MAGFAAVMLLVLAAAGAFVYWRVQLALDRQLDQRLLDASSSVAPSVSSDGSLGAAATAVATGESFQVLTTDGRVLDAAPGALSAPLLDPADVRSALDQPVRRDIGGLLPGDQQPLRVHATGVGGRQPGRQVVLAVAVDRNPRDEALRELLAQLVLAGLATMGITAVVGDRLARASLRPVERYRRRATDIAGGASGVRLEVPAGRDDEITRLGHTLNDMLVALEESLDHERRFVNDASHELRTPLTLIGTRVQLALRRPRTPAEHEQVLTEIKDDIDRLAHLADHLLALGADQAGATAGGPGEPVDLAAVVRADVERRRTLAAPGSPYAWAGSLSVTTSGPAFVGVPRHQLDRVVDNLLQNAGLHGAPPVTVGVETAGATARLTIVDAGPGVDASTLASAPQRFARAPEARNRPGSGLGLALVHAVVLAAGGELRLCSRDRHERFGPGLGGSCTHGPEMTVTVLLPVVATPLTG